MRPPNSTWAFRRNGPKNVTVERQHDVLTIRTSMSWRALPTLKNTNAAPQPAGFPLPKETQEKGPFREARPYLVNACELYFYQLFFCTPKVRAAFPAKSGGHIANMSGEVLWVLFRLRKVSESLPPPPLWTHFIYRCVGLLKV